jgi:hypothetical protein
VNPVNGTTVAAEISHRFSNNENSFTIGSSHALDQQTLVKTRFSDNGKAAMLCQREWRPKSLITFSAEYDSKANKAGPRLGLALALKPWELRWATVLNLIPFQNMTCFFPKLQEGIYYPKIIFETQWTRCKDEMFWFLKHWRGIGSMFWRK